MFISCFALAKKWQLYMNMHESSIMRTPPKNGTQCLGRKIILQPILHCVFIMVETTMVRSCLPHSSEIIFANISIFRTLYTVLTSSTAINWVELKLMELTLNTNQRVNQHSSNLSLCPFVHRSEEWKIFFFAGWNNTRTHSNRNGSTKKNVHLKSS